MGLADILDEFNKKRAERSSSQERRGDLGEDVWSYVEMRANSPDERRAPGYHPSQLKKLCPRLEQLKSAFPKPEAQHIAPESQLTWDWGTAWHWFCQNHIFGPMGILFGTWKCSVCARRIESSFMPEPCPSCWPSYNSPDPGNPGFRRGGYWWYEEPEVRLLELNVVGHVDGILIRNGRLDGVKSLLEIKTIDGEMFRRLSRVDDGYVFQANLYMWLLGLQECWLTYWSKDAKQVPPKVFRISYDPSYADEAKRRISSDRNRPSDGSLCTGICASPRDRAAIRCSHRHECFKTDIDRIFRQLPRTRSAGLVKE